MSRWASSASPRSTCWQTTINSGLARPCASPALVDLTFPPIEHIGNTHLWKAAMDGLFVPPPTFDFAISKPSMLSTRRLRPRHQRLNDELDWQPRPARRFTPHMTLLYDRQRIEEAPIEPINWMVSEMVLVESLVGQTIHRHLARVPLR